MQDITRSGGIATNLTGIGLPVALVAIIALLIIPLPTFLLDILLTVSMSLSILVLLVVIHAKESVELSVFPSLLLFLTLFRLTLNVASTKLILLNGYAGKVIDAFGNFVVGGNLVVGLVVFLILVVIQFIVINKGATRVSEVAARFTLDAMPGRQMSIDSDLNAGLITEQEARERRETLNKEAEFYGAMDGAGKFVQGDAIAGIVITFINLIGGISLGTGRGMPIAESVQTFSILTIGDGLGSQIPSFITAISMGILITKTRTKEYMGHDITKQIIFKPKPLAITAGILGMFVLIPGLPKIPLILLAAPIYALYRNLKRSDIKDKKEVEKERIGKKTQPKIDEKAMEKLLRVERLGIEIGYNLIHLADPELSGGILERIDLLRREIARELGFVVPPIRLRDNLQLEANKYSIKIKGQEIATGELYPERFLALDSGTASVPLKGTKTVDPAYGMPGVWIYESQKGYAESVGYTLVDPVSVLITHLSEIIKTHAHEIISREDVQKLIDNLNSESPVIVKEVIPGLVSLGVIHEILRDLLRERVSIRDLMTIMEAIGDYAPKNKDTRAITEHVRQALSRTICQRYLDKENRIHVVTIDPGLDQQIAMSIHRGESGAFLALEPKLAQNLIDKIIAAIRESISTGYEVVILSSTNTRVHLRMLIENLLPTVAVLSYKEIPFGIKVETEATINI